MSVQLYLTLGVSVDQLSGHCSDTLVSLSIEFFIFFCEVGCQAFSQPSTVIWLETGMQNMKTNWNITFLLDLLGPSKTEAS